MNHSRRETAVTILRWVLGLVLLVESLLFALSPAAAPHFAATGLPQWIRPTLGLAEAIAVLLFLAPHTKKLGAQLLLAILAIAALLHVLHGQYDVSPLAVYAAAVIVCMTEDECSLGEAS